MTRAFRPEPIGKNAVGTPPTRRSRKGESDDTPLYRLIVKALRSEIQRGVYPVGSILPSETELLTRFDVSRHTVRSAIRSLQDSGLVRTRQGLGTIVLPSSPSGGYVHQINTISDLFPPGAETRVDAVDMSSVGLPPAAGIFPELAPGLDWFRITGSRWMPGADAPFNEYEVFVSARFKGVGRVIGNMSPSVYVVLEALYGESVGEVEQVIGGFSADGQIGARIGLAKDDPGIEVRRIHRLASDSSIGIVSFNRYPLHDYTFSMVLRRVEA